MDIVWQSLQASPGGDGLVNFVLDSSTLLEGRTEGAIESQLSDLLKQQTQEQFMQLMETIYASILSCLRAISSQNNIIAGILLQM